MSLIRVIKNLFGLVVIVASYIKSELLYKLSYAPSEKYKERFYTVLAVIFLVSTVIGSYVWLVTKEPLGEYVETQKMISSEVHTVNVGDAFPLYNSNQESLRHDYVYLGSPETKGGVIQLVIGKKGVQDTIQEMFVTVNPKELIQPLAKVELDDDEYARVSFLEKKENAVVVKIDTILIEETYERYDTEKNREIKEVDQKLERFEQKINSFFN